jgi:dolichol-phosphate mannosyltransferase
MLAPAWVILPTYDEAATVAPLVRAVLDALPGARVLVVDDSSPDGTGRIAERLAAEHEAVQVLHRPRKSGLGRAYVAGFTHALAAGAGAVIEMDADFSHDPADLPRLVGAVADGADLVLGSRYVDGGGIADWGRVRRLLSRAGCEYARRLLGVGVRDLTGGFKCFSASALEAIDYASVRSQGYAFQVELTYRAIRSGLRVREVPIVFREREEGSSKMSARIALEAAWLVPALRFGRGPAHSGRPARLPIS